MFRLDGDNGHYNDITPSIHLTYFMVLLVVPSALKHVAII
jgi:hypothetical protein